jgi:hypothetical protein
MMVGGTWTQREGERDKNGVCFTPEVTEYFIYQTNSLHV